MDRYLPFLSKVNSEHEEKEDDVADHPGGKVEQLQAILDEKEVIKEPSKTLLRVINQFPTKFFIKNKQARVKSKHEAKEDDVADHREAKEAEKDKVADNPAEEAEEAMEDILDDSRDIGQRIDWL